MKIENIKDEFPIFDEKIQNNDLVYFDGCRDTSQPMVSVATSAPTSWASIKPGACAG